MAFDDRKTEPLIVFCCMSAICALVVPAVRDLLGWWSFLFLLPPVVFGVVIECVWRREDRVRADRKKTENKFPP